MVIRTAPLRGHRPALEGPGFLARARPPGPHRPPPRGWAPRHRPDRLRRGDRLRRDHLRRRPPAGHRRRADARPLPPPAARRRAPLRVRRRTDGLEEVDLPGPRPADPGHQGRPQGHLRPRAARHRAGRLPRAPAPATSPRSACRTRSSRAPPSWTRTTSPAGPRVFIVAVQCTTAASTCFCTSMGTGPEVEGGHDIVLTELDAGFLVEADSAAGRVLMEKLPLRPASAAEQYGAAATVAAVRARIGDPVPAAGLHDRLMAQLDHPRWAQVAERCITCGNCTLACPTCFCTTLTQVDRPHRRRRGDVPQLGQLLQPRLREGRRRQLPLPAPRPLPPVAHPQVRHLVGPVRQLRLRRLRPLHHLVPGRHRRPRRAERDRPGRAARPRDAARRAGRGHPQRLRHGPRRRHPPGDGRTRRP